MIFTITDRRYKPLDVYSTENYLIGDYTGSVLQSLDIDVAVSSARPEVWERGNYIFCEDSDGNQFWFTIVEGTDSLDGDYKTFECYSGTIDVLCEDAAPISRPSDPQPFSYYFDRIFIDTGIQIGVNEIAGLTRALEYTSENASNAEMIQYVLNGFDNAEAKFRVVLDGCVPTALYLDVFKRIGEERRVASFNDYDDSITELSRVDSIKDLATCLNPRGAEDEDGNAVTLTGKYFEEKDENGVVQYWSPTNSPRIFSRQGRDNFYVLLPGKDESETAGFINRRYSSEASTPEALWTEGLAQLKKIDHAIVSYEVSGYVPNARRGDNVEIISHRMKPPVTISARILERYYNDDDKDRNRFVFGNFEPLESEIDRLEAIFSDRLKPNSSYVWIRYADDDQGNGISASPAGKEYIAIKTVVNQPVASNDPAAYVGLWNRYQGDQGVPGPAGPSGNPTYTWIKYADDVQGTGMSDDPTGKYYIGLAANKDTPTESTNPADYKWQLVKGEDGQDAHIYQAYAWSEDGTDRFTTQYPNENGFQNSETPQPFNPYSGTIVTQTDNVAVPEWGATNAVGYKVTGGNATILGTFRSGMPNTIVGETHDYDISIYVKNTGTTDIIVSGNITPVTVVAPGEAKRIAWVVKNYSHPTGAVRQFVVSRQNTTDEASFVVWRAKYAYGSYTSIWTPKPSESFADAYPTHLGTYTSFDPVQSTDPADYTWARMLGNSGVGIKTTVVEYAVGTSATTAPTSDWQATPPAVGANQYLWTRITLTYDDESVVTSYSVGARGAQGPQGPTGPSGNGIDTSVVTYAAGTTGTTAPTTGWQATPPTVAANQFLWTKIVLTYTDGSSTTSYAVGKMGAQGPQGAKGDNGPQGPTGPTGNGIDTSAVTYAASTSGTTAPATGWQATPPTVAANQFLWTKIVLTYTDGSSTTSYAVGKMGAQGPQGVKGDTGPQGPTGPTGNGISSSTVNYAASTSGTTAPATGWQATPPTVAANSFLWTRVVINYTDGTSTTSYAVGKMGAQGPQGTAGAQGPQGPTGATGNGISSSVVNYAASASGTAAPTSGWATTPPTVAANQFLWTRVVITYTNGTTTTAYSVGKMGAQGPKGDTGAQGPTGPTGPQGPQGIQGVAYLQPTQPSTTQNGAQWFKTVSTTDRTVTDIYTYVTGSGWVRTPLAAGTLAVTSLSAISSNFGTMTAGTINGVVINGSEFNNSFTYTDGGVTYTGTTTIKDGNILISRTGSDGSTWTTKVDRQLGFDDSYKQSSGAPTRTTRLGQGKLFMAESGVGGYLPASALNATNWTNLTYAPGFTTAENNPCQYRMFPQLDGSTLIKFRGQFQLTSGANMGTATQRPFGDGGIPALIRPEKTEFAQGSSNRASGGRLAVTGVGNFFYNPETADQTYASISAISYYI